MGRLQRYSQKEESLNVAEGDRQRLKEEEKGVSLKSGSSRKSISRSGDETTQTNGYSLGCQRHPGVVALTQKSVLVFVLLLYPLSLTPSAYISVCGERHHYYNISSKHSSKYFLCSLYNAHRALV